MNAYLKVSFAKRSQPNHGGQQHGGQGQQQSQYQQQPAQFQQQGYPTFA
jgi:hypothetical protein